MNADITMVNVALVSLGKDLHADLSDLQWGLNSYMLAFAALIVTAGRLGRCLRTSTLSACGGDGVFGGLTSLRNRADNFGAGNRTKITEAGGALMLPAGMAIISVVYSAEERVVAPEHW